MEREQSPLRIPQDLLRYFGALREQLDELGAPQEGYYVIALMYHLPPLSPAAREWLMDVLNAHHYTVKLSDTYWLDAPDVFLTTPIANLGGLRLRGLSREELAALVCLADFYDISLLRDTLVDRLALRFMTGNFTDVDAAFVPRNAVEQVLLPVASSRWRDERWLREALGSLDLVTDVTRCWPQLGPLVACGDDHTLFVTRDGLWGSGSNEDLQLSLVGHELRTTPESLVEHQAMMRYVVSVACGLNFSMVVLANGELWSCGDTRRGQTGQQTDDEEDSVAWAMVRSDVVSVSCGDYHAMVVTRDGTVWACGDNADGQLGLGHTGGGEAFTLVRLPANAGRVLQVSCGGSHSAILTTTGLWMCGSSAKGQLGLGGDVDQSLVPVLLEAPGVRRVQCGHKHTLFETREGLCGCGSDLHFQLGLRPLRPLIVRPLLLDSEKLGYDIIDFAAGYRHSIVLSETGLWGTGGDGYGEMGRAKTTGNEGFDRMIEPLEGAGEPLFVVCGRRATFVATSQGLLACGSNHTGKLGLGGRAPVVSTLTPVPVMMGFEQHEKREADEPLQDERETQRRRLTGLLCTRCDREALGLDSLYRRYRFCSIECCRSHLSPQ